MARKPADPEEELRWMAQEVRGYVEAVLNSLNANVPKVSSFLKCKQLFYLYLYFDMVLFIIVIIVLVSRQLFFAK